MNLGKEIFMKMITNSIENTDGEKDDFSDMSRSHIMIIAGIIGSREVSEEAYQEFVTSVFYAIDNSSKPKNKLLFLCVLFNLFIEEDYSTTRKKLLKEKPDLVSFLNTMGIVKDNDTEELNAFQSEIKH